MISDIIREDSRAVVETLGETLAPLRGAHMLVSGAGGFLGSLFLDALDAFNRANPEAPCRVTALDNYRVAVPERLAHLADRPAFTMLRADVCEPVAAEQPDYILHLASMASPTIYRPRPVETIATNVNGTWRMLDLARAGARSMVSMSSSEVYGDPAVVPTPESYRGDVSFTGPRACYDESKRLGETLCVSYWREYGTPVKIIRPFNVYGPGQRLDDGRIVPDLMKAALAGGPIILYSDGTPTRSFCYGRDFVTATFLVLMSDADGEAFNVGNPEEIPIGDAARMMAEVAADPPLAVELRTSPDADFLVDNPNRRCPDIGKMRRMFGWSPQVRAREGFARTLESYRQSARPRAPAAAE